MQEQFVLSMPFFWISKITSTLKVKNIQDMHKILANNICLQSTETTSQPSVTQNDIYQSEKQVDRNRKSDIQRGKYLELGN